LDAATPPVLFANLWSSYPTENPCKGIENQCATRLSVALQGGGVSFKTYPGGKKPPCGILVAQELADWLSGGNPHRFKGEGTTEKFPGSEWRQKVDGRTGIIFFQDYWKRSTDKGGATTGDHIDLWNKNTLSRFGWASFFRFSLGIPRIPNPFGDGNWYSDLSKSRAVWFWEVK
jgi:hypothetical protein